MDNKKAKAYIKLLESVNELIELGCLESIGYTTVDEREYTFRLHVVEEDIEDKVVDRDGN